ncbi:unnamed protein product [Caenorhabditis bovis]|uniref:STAS domain-containing protein n=1 Tax=Caenorhabditis bovis TaxID=2654633 RepID=A0A8S1F8I9_9PELO|nr:unnamed protein product [Caenorhabditis bovis]
MDSISLLVGPPPNTTRSINQDDFDSRYNFVKVRKKRTNLECLKHYLIGENWILYQPPNSWTQLLPISTWINKYNVKETLPRDFLGALYLSALLFPQAIGYGVLIGNIQIALYSLFIPPLIYVFFGSAQHSSLGSLSFTSIMIYSSVAHSSSTIGTISFCCAILQLLQFLLPLEFIYSYISTSSLSGFSIGLFIRTIVRFLPQFLVFRGSDCKPGLFIANSTTEVKRAIQCFKAVVPCLNSSEFVIIIITILCSIILIVFRWRVSKLIFDKIGFNLPHEFILILLSTVILYVFSDPTNTTIQDLSVPTLEFSSWPTLSTLLDSFAISTYTMTSHMQITKSIAMEKMYKVHRKQELFCFSIISFISSVFGLLPPSSSYGGSNINIESSKFSLVSNVLSLIPTALMIYFGGPLINVLPMCAVGVMVITSFNGWYSDIKSIRSICYSSSYDAALAVSSIISAIIFPNVCTGFIFMMFLSIFSVAIRVQWPQVEVLAKLSETHFAEETRYEGDCLDTPVRIIRLGGPLLSVNCEAIRAELNKQAVNVKGLIGIGIGTRTASLRSQCPSAVGPKFSLQESVAARESFNLSANITIIQETDTSMTQPTTDIQQSILRFLILSFSGVTAIDKDMLTCISQVYGDLNSENIKILFAGVPAAIRDSMELLGFHNTVPRAAFFPNIQEALISARNTVLPFHMSVSMNGYRDVIALSCAASHSELNRGISPEAV